MIACLSRLRCFALTLLLLCSLGAEARAQHVVTPEEANKLTFDSLVSGGGGGGGSGGGGSRHAWHRSYAAPRYARPWRHAANRRGRGHPYRYAAGGRHHAAGRVPARARATAPKSSHAPTYRRTTHASPARRAYQPPVHSRYRQR